MSPPRIYFRPQKNKSPWCDPKKANLSTVTPDKRIVCLRTNNGANNNAFLKITSPRLSSDTNKSKQWKSPSHASVAQGVIQSSKIVAKIPSPASTGIPIGNLSRTPRAEVSVTKTARFSLGDFISSHESKKREEEPKQIKSWSSVPQGSPEPCSKVSLLDIQSAEEDLRTRRDQSCGFDGGWYLERRVRAGSISAIQEEEAKRKQEMELLMREQWLAEEQIKHNLEKQKEAEKKKNRNRKQKKGKQSSKAKGRNDHSGGKNTKKKSRTTNKDLAVNKD